MTRMRTIRQTLEYLKNQDNNCAITEWYLRSLLRSGKLRHYKAGNKYLINLDHLDEFLSNPNTEEITDTDYGKIRKVH